MVIVYGLREPGGPVRYVGQTSRTLRKRLYEHIRHARNLNCERNYRLNWITSLLRRGIKPEAVVLDMVPDSEWAFAEQWWISALKDMGANLVNSDETGSGLITGDWGRKGEDHYLSKLTDQAVYDICQKYATGNYTQDELASEYDVSHGLIHLVVNNEIWTHVERPKRSKPKRIKGRTKSGHGLTENDVKSIAQRYASGQYSLNDLAIEHGITHGAVHQIVTGKRWPNVERPITHARAGDIKIKYDNNPGSNGKCRGENGGNSILTNEQVAEIRQLYATGEYSQRELGERFGVAQQTVSVLVRRETWVDVQ